MNVHNCGWLYALCSWYIYRAMGDARDTSSLAWLQFFSVVRNSNRDKQSSDWYCLWSCSRLCDESCCSTLDSFELLNITVSVRAPGCSCIFNHRSDRKSVALDLDLTLAS